MNIAILIITIVFLVIVFLYDQERFDGVDPFDPGYRVRKELSAFRWSIILLIVINVIIGFNILTVSRLEGVEGLTLFKKIMLVILFVVLVVIPCLNIFFGLLRLGKSKIFALNLACAVLFFTEFLLYKKEFIDVF